MGRTKKAKLASRVGVFVLALILLVGTMAAPVMASEFIDSQEGYSQETNSDQVDETASEQVQGTDESEVPSVIDSTEKDTDSTDAVVVTTAEEPEMALETLADEQTYAVTNGNGDVLGNFATLEEAVSACPAEDPCTITLNSDVDDLSKGQTSTSVVIPAGKIVTLTSTSGSFFTITQKSANRHIEVYGSLTLDGVALKGSGTSGGSFNGGVFVKSGTLVMQNGAEIKNCYAQDGGGLMVGNQSVLKVYDTSSIHHNVATSRGGGVYAYAAGVTTLYADFYGQSSLHDNSAQQGGGIYGNCDYGNTTTIFHDNTSIYNNEAKWGGGVLNQSGVINFVDNASIDHNTAEYGGGLYCNSAWFKVGSATGSNVQIVDNEATKTGGGIYNNNGYGDDGSKTAVQNCTIARNTAGGNGGGVYNKTGWGRSHFENVIIEWNTAAYGGGIYNSSTQALKVFDSTIQNNSANYGGGIYVNNDASTVVLDNSTIQGNSALMSGGGIFTYKGIVDLTNKSIVTCNTAAETGGGVYVVESTFSLVGTSDARDTNPLIYGNTADLELSKDGSADDLYAAPEATLNLLAYSDMLVPDSFLATDWFSDVATEGQQRYRQGARSVQTVETGQPLTGEERFFVLGSETFKVDYHPNGGTGNVSDTNSPYPNRSKASALNNSFERAGYSFSAWNTAANGSGQSYRVGDTLTLTADITLYAQWQEVPVEPGPTPTDPETPTPPSRTPDPTPVTPIVPEEEVTTPEAPAVTPKTTETKPSTPVKVAQETPLETQELTEDEKRMEAQTGNPIVDIIQGNVPLGGFSQQNAWSLLSLLFAVIAALSSVVLCVTLFSRKKKSQQQDNADDEEVAETTKRRSRILKTVAIIVGLVPGLLFMLLEDLSMPMVWINNWTALIGFAFVVFLALLIVQLVARRKKTTSEEVEAAS